MKRLAIGCTIAASFVFGVGMSPAVGLGSHQTAYVKIFGNSSSCAFGRASVNDATFKGGAKTSNFAGCSSSNAHKNVPVGYLGAEVALLSAATSRTCGSGSLAYNGTSNWTKERTTSITSGSESLCPLPGSYFSVTRHVRWSDAGDPYVIAIKSPSYFFNMWRA